MVSVPVFLLGMSWNMTFGQYLIHDSTSSPVVSSCLFSFGENNNTLLIRKTPIRASTMVGYSLLSTKLQKCVAPPEETDLAVGYLC